MVRAFRQLAAAPSFSVPAVLGLALAIGAVVLLLAAVLLACVLPAVQAARVDPARTLAADA